MAHPRTGDSHGSNFCQVTVNDLVIAPYTADAWRGRVHAGRYFLTFLVSGVAVSVIAILTAAEDSVWCLRRQRPSSSASSLQLRRSRRLSTRSNARQRGLWCRLSSPCGTVSRTHIVALGDVAAFRGSIAGTATIKRVTPDVRAPLSWSLAFLSNSEWRIAMGALVHSPFSTSCCGAQDGERNFSCRKKIVTEGRPSLGALQWLPENVS